MKINGFCICMFASCPTWRWRLPTKAPFEISDEEEETAEAAATVNTRTQVELVDGGWPADGLDVAGCASFNRQPQSINLVKSLIYPNSLSWIYQNPECDQSIFPV